MKVGLIGLGKMGLNLGQNLIERNHDVVAYDLNSCAVEEMEKHGAKGTSNIRTTSNYLAYGSTWCS
jgi:6-phosphogluconate dehydrogenase